MIITKEINLRVSYRTLEHYISKGYDAEINKNINVSVSDLTNNSHVVIKVSCDICNKVYDRKYQDYNRYLCDGKYTCNKCNSDKRRITCLEKYGFGHVMLVDSIKDKIKDTCLIKYGVENPFQSSEVKLIIKNVCLEKYGVENPAMLLSIKDKIKNTCLQKYGVENPFQSYEIKNVIKSTILYRYGVTHVMLVDSIKDKIKNTCLEKYGVQYPMNNLNIKEKSKQTRIKNGNQMPDNLLSDWDIYRKEVKNETYKNKRKLFIDWDGFDFYDNEYIVNNKDYKDSNYPTIDHKISIFEGFKQKICPIIIGHIDNLCITKKRINSSKNRW